MIRGNIILTYPMAYEGPVQHILQVKVGGQQAFCEEESPFEFGCHGGPWSESGSVCEIASVKTANYIFKNSKHNILLFYLPGR